MDVREVGWGAWAESIWLRAGKGSFEGGKKPSGFTRCGELLD
jgi:hypothetical protein